MDQLSYYESKLAYETDSADLYESIENGEPVVVVDGRVAVEKRNLTSPALFVEPFDTGGN